MRAGESVVIFGVGGIGLAALAGARIDGASIIIAVDRVTTKLERARRLGGASQSAPAGASRSRMSWASATGRTVGLMLFWAIAANALLRAGSTSQGCDAAPGASFAVSSGATASRHRACGTRVPSPQRRQSWQSDRDSSVK